MPTSEIEKLERRYAENPHGLTFAPLAEVHRKNGDFARALELLTAGLELHPNYIPASIVLGRCHQDLGDFPSAEAAFAHVLRLDDENVIALKSLADINEKLERYADAEGWLRRLVAVDRSSEEAREQLRRVEAAKESRTAVKESAVGGNEEQQEEQHNAEPVDAEPLAPAPVLEMIDLSAEAIEPGREPESSRQVQDAVDGPAPELTREPEPTLATATTLPDVVSVAQAEPAPSETSGPPPQIEEPATQDAAVQPMPGLISAEFQPPLEATGGLGVETSEEVVLEVSGSSEFRVPDASEEFKSLAARLSQSSDTTPAKPSKAAPEPYESSRSVPQEPEFTVTETMAEALVQSGHSDEALRVYRELVRRNGEDPRFQARIQELESAPAQEPPQRRAYLAHETKGQSVAAFFHALLASHLPTESASAERRPASRGAEVEAQAGTNEGSLAAKYGEENLPVPPAVASGETSGAAVSFDDFFNSEPGGSDASPPGNSEPGKDDLDQFQSWLQNLKR
jgi:tetratricopeptide (TPR) repeat protein